MGVTDGCARADQPFLPGNLFLSRCQVKPIAFPFLSIFPSVAWFPSSSPKKQAIYLTRTEPKALF